MAKKLHIDQEGLTLLLRAKVMADNHVNHSMCPMGDQAEKWLRDCENYLEDMKREERQEKTNEPT